MRAQIQPNRLPALVALTIAIVSSAPRADSQPVVATGKPADAEPASSTPSIRRAIADQFPGAAMTAAKPLVQWGSVEVRPWVQYTAVSADGLHVSTDSELASHIDTITAGIRLRSGPDWVAEYAPSWISYSNPAFRNTVDQHARFDARVNRPAWRVQAGSTYTSSDAPLVETARQTGRETSTTDGRVSVVLTDALRFDATAVQRLSFIKAFSDTFWWSLKPELALHVDTITAGLGCEGGYVLIYDASDITYTRPVAQINWHPTNKTTIEAEAGWDRWKFIGAGTRHLTGGYCRLLLMLHPFDETRIIVTGERGVQPTPFRNQVAENESATAMLGQRLFGHINLDVMAAYQRLTYRAETTELPKLRGDSLQTYTGRLSIVTFTRGTAGFFYRHMRNRSNQRTFGFTSRQVGIELTYRY
jgi:hypothetical protein